MIKSLVHYLLKNYAVIPFQDWTVQGFGFLRLRLDDATRLHVWDSRLRTPGVSDIHDHTQWAFTSQIISGSLINVRYDVVSEDRGQRHHMAVLNCGIGGGMAAGPAKDVNLLARQPELYLPGSSYRQEPDEVHRTMPVDGTVTLITQERRPVDTARVFWPFGGAWGDAVPRQAEPDEIKEVVRFALSIW